MADDFVKLRPNSDSKVFICIPKKHKLLVRQLRETIADRQSTDPSWKRIELQEIPDGGNFIEDTMRTSKRRNKDQLIAFWKTIKKVVSSGLVLVDESTEFQNYGLYETHTNVVFFKSLTAVDWREIKDWPWPEEKFKLKFCLRSTRWLIKSNKEITER